MLAMSILMEMLEQSINSLKEYMAQMFFQYPLMETNCYKMAILSCQKVDEELVAVREG